MWRDIKTPAQAIDELGGPAEVATYFKDVDARAIAMWRQRQRLPPKAWLVLEPILRERGRFSPALFNMLEPRRRARDGER